jgi:uncharacterized protein with HEPN domain
MLKADQVRLRHMLDAAQEAMGFARGRQRGDLAPNRMLTLSLVKCVEIIGEAASKISPETRAQFPAVPWVDIAGMRNRLIHAYFDIDLDRVWDTVISDLPPLVAELEKVLGTQTGSD